MPSKFLAPMPTKISNPAVVNTQRRIPVAVPPLGQFFERVRRELAFPESSVTVRLISDAAMARLNESFRGKPGPTDVLSFPAQSSSRRRNARAGRGGAPGQATDADVYVYVGDIAISPETAAHNARTFSRSLAGELRILILHGMIHLAGYDHETDHGEMHRFEQRLRRKLNLARPSRARKQRPGRAQQQRPARAQQQRPARGQQQRPARARQQKPVKARPRSPEQKSSLRRAFAASKSHG
jgi:probable rRNA maturation factor